MSSGRKKHSIWSFFLEKKQFGKKGSRATCKNCNKELQGLVERLIKHHQICSSSENESADSDLANNSFVSEGPSKMRKLSSLVTNYMCITSKTKQEKIDFMLTEMFAACNVPFRVVEHPKFINFIKELRPSYAPPNRKRLSSEMIPQVHDYYVKDNKKILNGVKVCLAVDGWKNIRNEPLICTTITCDNGDAFLVSTEDTSGMENTAENLLIIGTFYKQF